MSQEGSKQMGVRQEVGSRSRGGLSAHFGSYSKFDGKLSGVWGRRVTYLGFHIFELAVTLRPDQRGGEGRSGGHGSRPTDSCPLGGWGC